MLSSRYSNNSFYKKLYIQSDFQLNLKIKQFLSKLSIEQKISQLFLVNIEGKDNFIPINDFISGSKKGILPGGYLLFSYNLSDSPKTLKRFLSEVENAHITFSDAKPFFTVDCEGGYVNRLSKYQKQKLPSQEYVSKNFSELKAKALYHDAAFLLNECGIDLNFAPVVEVKASYNAAFLADRSYGSLADVVKFSLIQINEYKKNNCLSVIKHFPGNSKDDPHSNIAVLDVDKNTFESELLIPFKKVLESKPHGVLISHVIIKSIDDVPACFSKTIVTEYLKEKLHYRGIVYSDDIYMKALTQDNKIDNVALSVSKAFKAGINVIMSSEKKYLDLVYKVAQLCENDYELTQHIEESVFKFLKEKYKKDKLTFSF